MNDQSQSLTAPERETTVVTSDDDELVHIWTAQKRHITRLRRHSGFTEVKSGYYGTTEWAEFTTLSDQWSPAGVKRSISLSSEQRMAAARRMSVAREAKP